MTVVEETVKYETGVKNERMCGWEGKEERKKKKVRKGRDEENET